MDPRPAIPKPTDPTEYIRWREPSAWPLGKWRCPIDGTLVDGSGVRDHINHHRMLDELNDMVAALNSNLEEVRAELARLTNKRPSPPLKAWSDAALADLGSYYSKGPDCE